jgi:mono/diheme cytochrome c family protein
MRCLCSLGALLVAAAGFGLTQQEQKPAQNPPPAPVGPAVLNPHYAISDEDKARKNPVPFTEGSVERGRKLFASQCAMCHGVTGDGQGEVAKDMNVALPDFTKPATLQRRTDGELFKILSLGNEAMPPQDKRMSEIHRWQIINFLRTAGGAVPKKSTKEEMTDEHYVEVPH